MKKADDLKPTETRDIRAAKAEATRLLAERTDPTPSGLRSTDYDPQAQPEDVALRYALDGSRVYAAVLASEKLDVTIDDARATPAEKSAENPIPVGPQEYPSYRYHRTEPPRVITSKDQEEAGWADKPFKGNPPPAPGDGTEVPRTGALVMREDGTITPNGAPAAGTTAKG